MSQIGQPPVLLAAELGDLAQGIVVLVAFDPQAGEAGGNVLGQLLGKGHPRYPYGMMLRGYQ